MKIEEFIESGILEAYVLGSASEAETLELLYYKEQYPQVQQALLEVELDMERIAEHMAITPPPTAWARIEDSINDLIVSPGNEPLRFKEFGNRDNGNTTNPNPSQYIDVESETTHMRIHKVWKWVFAAVFVLGKIFLGCAIYFYLENRQAQQQIQDLKTELRQIHRP